MEDYKCFEISFPDVDFDSYWSDSKKSNIIQHAHLYTKENEIELRIFFDPETCFGRKFSSWLTQINLRKFGSFITAIKENQNDRLLKIDFTNSSLIQTTSSTSQYEGNLEYIIIKIDSIKFYWIPSEEKINTGEFYFNDDGFRVVKDFYGILFGWDGEFKINRMNGIDMFYPIEKAQFRPEFDFCFNDDRAKDQATIIKKPKLQFFYKEKTSEKEAVLYGEIINLLASFYFHTKIDFILSRIHFPEHTITIKKIQNKNYKETSGGFSGFKNHWNFHQFLQSDWQVQTFKNIKKLSKVIQLFNQSHIVDSSSSFLIQYNIIEICMGGITHSNTKFEQILESKEVKKKYEEALNILYQTIKVNDQLDFKKKWELLSAKLIYKPMKSPLLTFLENQKLNPSEFPISIDKIKSLRDDITHGSIDKIDFDILEKANILLYRITGILILNLIGINEWKLDTKLN